MYFDKISINGTDIFCKDTKGREDLQSFKENFQTFKENLPYITPEDYGAVGDGITDDYTAIKNCITASATTNRPILFSSKKYVIGSTIELENGFVDFNGCTLINKSNGYAIVVGKNSTTIYNVPVHLVLRNLNIDCNGNSGIEVSAIHCIIQNIYITNVGKVGIHNKLGYENSFENCYIEGSTSHQAIGFKVSTSDGFYNDLYGKNLYTAFELNASLIANNIHFWIGDISLYIGSTFVKQNGYGFFTATNVNCDTYSKFIECPNNILSCDVTNLIIQYNDDFIPASADTFYFSLPADIWLNSARQYCSRIHINNAFLKKPNNGSFKLISAVRTNELAPIKFSDSFNQGMNEDNECVDITKYSQVNNPSAKVLAYWGNKLTISGYFTTKLGNAVCSISSYEEGYFGFDEVHVTGLVYNTTDYTYTPVDVLIKTEGNKTSFFISTTANISETNRLYVNCSIPLLDKSL